MLLTLGDKRVSRVCGVIDEWQGDEIVWDMLSKLYLATICCVVSF